MEMVLRAAEIYFILLIIFKIAGRRTLMQLTNFDLILLLIISEATQQAMLSTDYSVTGSMLTIVTLVGVDILFGYIKKRFSQAENFIDGSPVIVVENGAVIDEKIKLVNISVDDILLAARQHHGIYELKAIKFAILERNGQISIIPEKE
ncbi:DUF421 domain-containing protein [Klebsiella variicola]|uniref:DUF421 domain-containing protein n=1 Tax=Klebsiella variicola TaxID=244366 RepID=UPI00097CC36F|nr:YetF domain-containing protein [Klebsiella variicola]HCB1412062.1 DUF421 domain-containing protein [Klebsiella variicola subsp. variicola]AQL16265.1 hypothetical protein BBD63_13735 [Klebsiella variicola]AQL21353.1 hypothetical protein BBD64_13730 [Klebsiella variicola]AQL27115.1 hypothetical protein BBD65_13730 [Klebsiella variicola]MBR7248054.1 DUF421 domain-containing protein [Klebsiella variicola]